MDFSWSGVADAVYEQMQLEQRESKHLDTEELRRFMAGASQRVTGEVVFAAIDDALAALGKTREDLDKALEEQSGN